MPAGRPSSYTSEMADKICALIVEGESVLQICKRKDMPSQNAVYQWLAKYPEFSEKYARARQQQAEVYAQDIINIADNSTPETYQVDRLRIDARKWKASKLQPKKYGDKLDVEHKGAVNVVIAPEHDGI